MKNFIIYRSKSGLPCLWEEGGSWLNTGQAQCIADSNGKPKTAIYIKRSGVLACEKHALIPINDDDILIIANHHRSDFDIEIHRVTGIEPYKYMSEDFEKATTELITEFSMGEWSNPLDEIYNAAVQATKDKAMDYHCRKPYYIKNTL